MSYISRLTSFATTIFFLSSFFAFAQQQVAAIPLQGKVYGFAQCAFSGDTTFVAYMEHVDHTTYYRTRLVFGDGSYKVISDSRLQEKVFVGIDNAQDSLYIYFLDVRRKTTSISYVANGDSLKTNRIVYTLPKEEIIIGIVSDPTKKGFQLLTASTVNQTMTLMRVHGREAIEERKITLPIPIFGQTQTSLAFIPEGHIPSPREAAARVKVYWYANRIIITEDVLGNYVMKTTGKTTMISIDSTTGEHKIRLHLEPTPVDFSTYVHNNILYKIQRNKKTLTIEGFDSLNRIVHSFKVSKKNLDVNKKAYERNERSGSLSQNASVKKVLGNAGDIFMSVHPTKDNTLLFKVGSHRALGDPNVVPAMLAFGLVGAIIMTGISNEYYNRQYEDRYFYLSGSTSVLQYVARADFAQQRIDLFEDNHTKENMLSFKSYGQSRNAVFGLYVVNQIPELRVVRFEK